MSRIPTHTVEDAPEISRPLLENVIQFSPTGHPLNMHAQMAHSPAVLVAYTSLRAGKSVGDEKIDALTRLVREAAADSGRVTDVTWNDAQGAGWNDEQLAETFVYLALTLFTAYFLNYARTDIDV
jgi:hypothetical protein